MLTVYSRQNGRVVQGSIDALKPKTDWIDCINPTKKELITLSKLSHIPLEVLKDRLVSYERPTTLETTNFSMIVFGSPVVRKNDHSVSSIAIFICKNKDIITLRTDETKSIEDFKTELLEHNPQYFDSNSKTVRVILERIIDSFFNYLELFEEKTDELEAVTFERPNKKAITETFKIRKALLFFHKTLVANREVIVSIEKEYLSRIEKKEIKEFKELREDILQLIDATDTLRNILTGILELYTSSISNLTNHTIKKLTVVASYVLIPTLIASIYGMNFRFMPELPWKWGYPLSLGIMAVSILVVYFYFRKSNLL
jgi:magnesium transporter